MASRTYSAAELVGLLSTALGAVQAKTVVDEALRRAGVTGATFDADAARRTLSDVAAQSGLIGITGRIALSRLDLGSAASGQIPSPALQRRPLSVVTKLLAAALGEERATTVVLDAAARLSIAPASDVDLGQALAILELLANTSGVTSAAARFAKSRIHLNW
ncbi:MAG: hypothetical protein U0414_39520 [Polyangiaceae bacterium]